MAASSRELVVLVDNADACVGILGKMEAHQRGALHRAISVSLNDSKGRLLLQKRAFGKYHSGGLWTNTCCGHPRPDEEAADAAHRRLMEEMGLDCALTPIFRTSYRAVVSNNLIENEFVHVFGGRFDGTPRPDPTEVEDWRWETVAAITADVARKPESYSVWFRRYIAEFRGALTPLA
jgi:isopentenyl-diphosphate delta-isomerase